MAATDSSILLKELGWEGPVAHMRTGHFFDECVI